MSGCEACQRPDAGPIGFSMAFQPIVDLRDGTVFAHEALVRGLTGEGAALVLASVNDDNRYRFDQQIRVRSIEIAHRLGLTGHDAKLSINFMPDAVYEPRACIRATLAAADAAGFPPSGIIFEFTEDQRLDTDRLLSIVSTYKSIGFLTAIDDFGAGYAGLSLLAKFQPDIVKLDMELTRGIDRDRVKQTIVRHVARLAGDLGVTVVCEGIETAEELAAVADLGIFHAQGYLLASPAFEALAVPRSPLAILGQAAA